jgi:hypothetical protein
MQQAGQVPSAVPERYTPVARRSIGAGPAPLSDAPYLVEGAARAWPAVGRWTPSYLREVLGHHRVLVSGGADRKH